MARRRRRSRTVFETRSRASGRIRVVDYRVERRLLVSGEILSVYPLDGDWSRVRREYWWRALAAIELPPRPTALFVGLGGGTQIHLLERLARPRLITGIERDPGVVPVARDWVALDATGPMEILCADAAGGVGGGARARRGVAFATGGAACGARPRRRGASCGRPRTPSSCPRPRPRAPRPRRPECVWRSGRGTSDRG